MRKSRSRKKSYTIKRHWLFGAIGFLAFIFATVNCTFDHDIVPTHDISSNVNQETEMSASSDLEMEEMRAKSENEDAKQAVLSEMLWADVAGINDAVTTPRPTHTSPERISLDVREADLLDVLSLLAYKLDGNIIFLGVPGKISIKTSELSPITTFQLVLQKEGLDYLTLGRNYIVGARGRLYGDFYNRMFLSRYSLFYVSASAMEGYIGEMGVPVESLTVDTNEQAIWMQGTPMALGKARELINSLDIIENAAFAEGGARKIRMPVATATGPRAEEELEALIDLLSILLDGFRDGRTDMGWVTWDHPDPVPRIYMDWSSPIIKPYDIMMKITRDFANDASNQVRYLIAEGKPDNIELVNEMIVSITQTPRTQDILFDNDTNNNDTTAAWVPPDSQGASYTYFSVTLNGVPPEAGTLSGGGSYSEGSNVTVTATAADGYNFVRWIEGGSEVSTNASYTFNIYYNRTLEAVFISSNNENGIENVEENLEGQ